MKKYFVEVLVWIVTITILSSMILMTYSVRTAKAYCDKQYEDGWNVTRQIIRIGNVHFGYTRNQEGVHHTVDIPDNGFYVYVE